ncbi:peptide ABC transporter substrate-binding protein [Sporosarcina sp. SAFN-015]|uniref:peptide ABC transporter substrate-binding protein n=1 Tax=Sporosarcina sp. SAFN-015 TaxID=3387274 RepID=UPI003F7D7FCC
MRKVWYFMTIIAALSIILTLIGCSDTSEKVEDGNEVGSKDTGTATGKKEQVLKVGLAGDQGGFDPATGTTDTPQQVIGNVYKGLFSIAEDGTMKNEIAESYDVSPDGMVYTFKLRSDAKWSDGVPVTAEDFVYGWTRNLVPELKASYADLMDSIKNFSSVMAGEMDHSEFGVKALNDTTFEVTLSRIQPYFVQLTTFSPFYPVREDKVPMDSSAWSAENVSDIVTNGPFKFQEYNVNDKVVLVPNKEYYNSSEVVLDRLEFYFIPDPQVSAAAFKNGEIDMAFSVPQDVNDTHKEKNEVKRFPYLSNMIINFNVNHEAFSDKKVREAFNIGINRKQLTDIIGGTTQPLYALVPAGLTNPSTGKDFREEGGDLIIEDIEKAKNLLAEAGYPNGEGFPVTTYLYNNDNQMHIDIAQGLQGMLKKNLNVDIELKGMEFATFRIDRNSGNHDFVRHGTSADYADPTTWLKLYMSSTQYIQDLSGYSTPEYDELVEESELTLDPAKRFKILHEAEEIIVNEFVWLPILTNDKLLLAKDYVKNFYATSSGAIVISEANVTDK